MTERKGVRAAKLTLKIVFGAVIVLFMALFIMSKVSSNPIFLFNKTTMWVMTESMDPTIPPRTYILVEKATADDVEEGDIIVFRSSDPRIKGQFNTHRLVFKSGDNLVTKGDNNASTDGAYSPKPEDVVGKYVKSLSGMTFLGRVAMTPVGYAVLVIVFIATMVICVIPDVKEAVKAKEEDDEEKKKKEIRRLIDEEVRRLKETGNVSNAVESLSNGVEKPTEIVELATENVEIATEQSNILSNDVEISEKTVEKSKKAVETARKTENNVEKPANNVEKTQDAEGE